MAETPAADPQRESRLKEAQLRRERADAARAKYQAEMQKLRSAVNEVLKTPAGRILFAYLHNLCLFTRSTVAVDRVSGEIQPLASAHNEGMRTVYLKLRGKAAPDLLALAEQEAEKAAQIEPEQEKT